MSEPLFLQSVMHEKIWGGRSYEMNLAMKFPVTKWANTGRFRLIHTVFLP